MIDSLLVAAVVLAAGGSTRLGEPKQLLDLGGLPLLEYVMRAVRRSNVDQRYVVLGFAADRIREQVSLDGFSEIINPDFMSGQSTSVCAAIEGIDSAADAVIFVLGDQPLQSQSIIDKLAESFRGSPAAIIQPEYREGPGNPVLISRELFPELARLTGDTGARPLLRQRRDEIRYIDCRDTSRPADVDTWDDYENVKRQYSESDLARET